MSNKDPLQVKVKALYIRKALKLARPWRLNSPERLTAKEFLSLVGVKGKGRNYRRAIVWLAMAAVGDDNDCVPEVLKAPFRDGMPCVHAFHGRGDGAVAIEYRIPVESLHEKYSGQIQKLLSLRKVQPQDSLISPKTLAQLRFLSRKTGGSLSDVLATSVTRMVEAVVGEGHHIPAAPRHAGNVY